MKIKLVVLCLSLFGFSGCLLPTVNLNNALLTKLTDKDMEVGLKFDVFNPNEYQLPISGIDWDLDLFQADFTKGDTAFSRSIGAKKNVGVDIPVGVSFQSLAVGATGLLTQQKIPWGFGGGMAFRSPTKEPLRIGFNADGAWANPLLDGTVGKVINDFMK